MPTRTETVTVDDGGFALHVRTPASGTGPGLLLIQEIFGVGEYLREVAADLAALGYVVAAPDMFWRIRPGWAVEATEETVRQSMRISSRFDEAKGVDDLVASLARLRDLPEVSGGTGALGFCFGGTLAYLLAARTRLDAAVSFYGSGVPGRLDLLDRISGPVQFHFGGSDPFIERGQVAEVERAVDGRPGFEIHVQEDGGHAFHNRTAPMFYQPGPAERAWALTETYLAEKLPTSGR
ncbi:dienelactone hydrolase family protein [Spirillospora sp. NBC_01491]|uniref:dienelactone hydrolase family protein n=1 Tax=Spirillospora sp. NBC_01491 TaxID=2976007 RepID=UPI002E34AA94|nr:dienelactone hydrolase family protein [Spirillospora sp. NBC_01491]